MAQAERPSIAVVGAGVPRMSPETGDPMERRPEPPAVEQPEGAPLGPAMERRAAPSEEAPGPRIPAPVPRVQAAGRRRPAWLMTIIEIVVIVGAAFAIALLVQAFLVKPFTIHQVSMRPTLEDGDRILLNRLAYRFGAPARGDIIVFPSPISDNEDLVKRVVGVARDRLSISGGKLYVNGVAQAEPYLLEQGFSGEMAEMVVPDGEVFVMGDNRNNSGDSRLFGPISTHVIIGKAFVVYWPVGHWKTL